MKSYMIILLVSLILLINFENVNATPKKKWLSRMKSAASASSSRSTTSSTPRSRSLSRVTSQAERNLINRRSDYQCWYRHYLPFFQFLENTSYFPGVHAYLTENGFLPTKNFIDFYEQNPPSNMDARISDKMCRDMQSNIMRTYSDLVGNTFVQSETVTREFAAKILELCDKIRTDGNCSENSSLEFAYSRIKGARALDAEFRQRCVGEDAQSDTENVRNR